MGSASGYLECQKGADSRQEGLFVCKGEPRVRIGAARQQLFGLAASARGGVRIGGGCRRADNPASACACICTGGFIRAGADPLPKPAETPGSS